MNGPTRTGADVPDLERGLGALGAALAFPRPSTDIAALVAARIATDDPRHRRRWWTLGSPRPLRRSLLAAIALLLALATVAAAVGWWLPGLRIVPAPPGSPVPSVVGPAGAVLGAGTRVELSDVPKLVGFTPLLPASAGPPEEVYVVDGRLTLVWKPREGLPPMPGTGLGLVLTQLRGEVDRGFYEKQVMSGTSVEPVVIRGRVGYWLSGRPHALVYRAADGEYVEETRRVVGDVLVWRRDGLTHRIESALGRDGAVALGESLAPAP